MAPCCRGNSGGVAQSLVPLHFGMWELGVGVGVLASCGYAGVNPARGGGCRRGPTGKQEKRDWSSPRRQTLGGSSCPDGDGSDIDCSQAHQISGKRSIQSADARWIHAFLHVFSFPGGVGTKSPSAGAIRTVSAFQRAPVSRLDPPLGGLVPRCAMHDSQKVSSFRKAHRSIVQRMRTVRRLCGGANVELNADHEGLGKSYAGRTLILS
jgi:hypothetical protein